jgi:hypothetical protein
MSTSATQRPESVRGEEGSKPKHNKASSNTIHSQQLRNSQFHTRPSPSQAPRTCTLLSSAHKVWKRHHNNVHPPPSTPPVLYWGHSLLISCTRGECDLSFRGGGGRPPWMPPPGSWPRHTRRPLGWTQSGHAGGRTECAGPSPPAHSHGEGTWGEDGGGGAMLTCECVC